MAQLVQQARCAFWTVGSRACDGAPRPRCIHRRVAIRVLSLDARSRTGSPSDMPRIGHRFVRIAAGTRFLTGKLRNPKNSMPVIIGALLRDFGAKTSSGTRVVDRIEKLPARKIAPQPNSLSLGSWPREATSFRSPAPSAAHIRRKCRIGPRYSYSADLARIDQELRPEWLPATGTIQSEWTV